MPQTFYPGQPAADYLAELNALAAGQAATATPTFAGLTITGSTTLGDAEATDTLTVKGASTVLANSANPALMVTQMGGGNAFEVFDQASDTTPFVIDGVGRAVFGAASTTSGLYGGVSAVHVTGPGGVSQSLFANSAAGVRYDFLKSRSTVFGAHTIVQAGDDLGGVYWGGSDGVSFIPVAHIKSEIDGTPGTNDMPGRLIFSTTPDGGATPAEAMRVGNDRTVYLGAAPGAESLRVVPVASAVNRLHLLGAATGASVTTVTEGSDAAVTAVWAAKGAAPHIFRTGGTAGSAQFVVAHTASAVNYPQVTGGATGSAVTVSAQGSDAAIDLALTPKSTGVVRFGTWTSNADAAVNGYVTIKDAAGNIRKLATIA